MFGYTLYVNSIIHMFSFDSRTKGRVIVCTHCTCPNLAMHIAICAGWFRLVMTCAVYVLVGQVFSEGSHLTWQNF